MQNHISNDHRTYSDEYKFLGEPEGSPLDSSLESNPDDTSFVLTGNSLHCKPLSVGKFVLATSERSVQKYKPETSLCERLLKLVTSLVWVFVARLSHNKKELFKSTKELDRFTKSVQYTTDTIASYIVIDPLMEECELYPLGAIISDNLDDISQSPDKNDEQTYLKFCLDSILCKIFGDPELPQKPSFEVKPLFSGYLKRYLDRRIVNRDVSFGYSLQKGAKKLWPALGLRKLYEACQKHRNNMMENRGPVPHDLREKITEVSRRIFGDITNSDLNKYLPTGSSSLQATINEGGNLSLFPVFRPTEDLKETINLLDNWRQEGIDICIKKIAETPVRHFMRQQVVAIPEPGKFRLISKGDTYLNTLLQPLQGALIKKWRDFQFSTMDLKDIGSRLTEMQDEWRVQLSERAFKWSDDDADPGRERFIPFYWVSGDYEAATDKQKKDATFACLEGIGMNNLLGLASLSFSFGSATYPLSPIMRENENPLIPPGQIPYCEPVKITEGQLMGHPLSFPLLCSINLAVYHTAIERWVKDNPTMFRKHIARIMRKSVLVNGDDILYRCQPSFQEIFVKTAKEAGFHKSIGKNYMSLDTCMINSQVFQLSGKYHEQVFRRKGYLNLNIVYGNNIKKQSQEGTALGISEDLNTMMKHCSWTASAVPFAISKYKEINQMSTIVPGVRGKGYKIIPFTPNWFLPLHLGGLGINPQYMGFPDINGLPTWKATRAQRMVAKLYTQLPEESFYRTKGMVGPFRKLNGLPFNIKMIREDQFDIRKFAEQLLVYADEAVDEWKGKLAYMARAMHGKSETDHKFLSLVGATAIRDKTTSFLDSTPLTHEQVILWSSVKFLTHLTPICPPFQRLRIPRVEMLSETMDITMVGSIHIPKMLFKEEIVDIDDFMRNFKPKGEIPHETLEEYFEEVKQSNDLKIMFQRFRTKRIDLDSFKLFFGDEDDPILTLQAFNSDTRLNFSRSKPIVREIQIEEILAEKPVLSILEIARELSEQYPMKEGKEEI